MADSTKQIIIFSGIHPRVSLLVSAITEQEDQL